MAGAEVPQMLVERLGAEGTAGLIALLESTRTEWTDDVLASAVDRFEHRLGAEVSLLRVDFTRETAALRQDMTREMSMLRQDMTREMSVFREDMGRELSVLRQDVTRDLSNVRVELLKWSFLFWIGQVAAIAGLLSFMLRA